MSSNLCYYFQKQKIKELEQEVKELQQILRNVLIDGLYEELDKDETALKHTDAFKKHKNI